MGVTSIEWTDRSVNPIRARIKSGGAAGHYCEKVSSGCAHCYSSRMQRRFGMPEFPGTKGNPGVEVFFDESRLQEVLRRKVPTKWFWCDMTDVFGHWVPDEWIDKCFAAMALTPQHTHQVLTKRPERAAEYLAERSKSVLYWQVQANAMGYTFQFGMPDGRVVGLVPFPIPNVWLGTSVENQETADERIPHLLRCPAAVRFVSAEPLLGPIDLREVEMPDGDTLGNMLHNHGEDAGIDWVIVGGESGPGARRFDLNWDNALYRQCKVAGVAYFRKQIGSNAGWTDADGDWHVWPTKDKKGGDPAEWPEVFRCVREFPQPVAVSV